MRVFLKKKSKIDVCPPTKHLLYPYSGYPHFVVPIRRSYYISTNLAILCNQAALYFSSLFCVVCIMDLLRLSKNVRFGTQCSCSAKALNPNLRSGSCSMI